MEGTASRMCEALQRLCLEASDPWNTARCPIPHNNSRDRILRNVEHTLYGTGPDSSRTCPGHM